VGDREADVADDRALRGFPAGFLAAYRADWNLDDGYTVRRDLYNLYHVLNHANLFAALRRQASIRSRAAGRDRMSPSERDSRRILVVDDNADAADSLACCSKCAATRCASAYDGIEALATEDEFRPESCSSTSHARLSGYDVASVPRGARRRGPHRGDHRVGRTTTASAPATRLQPSLHQAVGFRDAARLIDRSPRARRLVFAKE